jgi:hypothetical protein
VYNNIIQVVYKYSTAQLSFSNSSGVVLSSVITPRFATSKILVIVDVDAVTLNSDGSYGSWTLRRNSSVITRFGYPYGWASTDNAGGTTINHVFLDSPASTSATTYDYYWNNMNGAVSIDHNRDNSGTSNITLMEVAQ